MTVRTALDQEVANTFSGSDLIEQSLQTGERFAEVFDRHAVAIHRYLLRRIGRSLADDLTAETFLVAFRQRQRYDTSHPDARPWLYGIATNLLRREQRAEIRQYPALARTGVDPASEHVEEEVVARVVASGAYRRFAAVLAKLPVGERSVLLLIAWEQLSYDEVARAMGVPIGTVRSRLHSARKRIRAVMGDLDPNTYEQDKPVLKARPDQFVYVESVTAFASFVAGPDGMTQQPTTPLLRQVWLSVDGTRDGLLRQKPLSGQSKPDEIALPVGCRNGKTVSQDGGIGRPCQPAPAFRTDLPTNTDAMLNWLYQNSHGDNPRNVEAFFTVEDLIQETYLTPAELSALFSATSQIPGVTVDKDALDASGRHGIGITMGTSDGELVFDPKTYEYLGEREHGAANEANGANGAARIRIAIVDSVGQLP